MAEAEAGPWGALVQFAIDNGIGWWELVGGTCLIISAIRIPGTLHGIADVIRAKRDEEKAVKARREKLIKVLKGATGLESDTAPPKISKE